MRIDAAANAQSDSRTSAGGNAPQNTEDLSRLEHLWNERQTAGSNSSDYPIGPGDVLTISVSEVEQLAQRRVRVSTRGTIELPLIGVVQAGGFSEDGLASELDDKLGKYMYRPQATVFVDEYRNREVAVIGAVNRPGLVLLTSPSESLLDVLTQAGGLSGAASDELVLIPSRPGTVSTAQWLGSTPSNSLVAANRVPNEVAKNEVVSDDSAHDQLEAGTAAVGWRRGAQYDRDNSAAGPETTDGSYSGTGGLDPATPPQAATAAPEESFGATPLAGRDERQFATAMANESQVAIRPTRLSHNREQAGQTTENAEEARSLAGAGDAITLKLKGQTLTGVGKYMNIPMRPGDVVIVPGGGDVMVVGWVHQPGRFQAGSGLTVLGAIGAAGGPMYAANTRNIALIRTAKRGSKVTIPIDMAEITSGQASDLPVQANDVIDVPYSGLRIGPYIFYSILTKMGLGAPIIPY
jgi:polysaccharide export outer membrane protein